MWSFFAGAISRFGSQREAAKRSGGKTRTESFDKHTRHTVNVGVLGRVRG